jgi:hypothetical protein
MITTKKAGQLILHAFDPLMVPVSRRRVWGGAPTFLPTLKAMH